MSKIEKALEELDALMAEVNTLRKEEDDKEMMDMADDKEKGDYMKEMVESQRLPICPLLKHLTTAN